MVNAIIEQALPQEDVYLIELNNPTGRSSPYTLKFDWANLPDNTKIFFVFERLRFSGGGRIGVGTYRSSRVRETGYQGCSRNGLSFSRSDKI